MNCPSCQKPLQEDTKFCPHCGAAATKNLHCTSCGKQVDPTWIFCPTCGASLKGRPTQNIPVQPPQPPPPQHYPQDPYPPHYSHGHHYDSSSRKHRRKGFLGHLFSS